MSLVSWAKKELARFKVGKNNRRSLPSNSNNDQSSLEASMSLPLPLKKEWILDADLGCLQCQRRLSTILTQIDDVESMVFHVFEKKVTFTRKSTAYKES